MYMHETSSLHASVLPPFHVILHLAYKSARYPNFFSFFPSFFGFVCDLRCDGFFCALHRYAEAHACTYDYKTEGRQFLARTNPVVAALKLPNI